MTPTPKNASELKWERIKTPLSTAYLVEPSPGQVQGGDRVRAVGPRGGQLYAWIPFGEPGWIGASELTWKKVRKRDRERGGQE